MLKDNYSAILSNKAPGFTKKRFYLGIIIETIQAISLNFVRYAESLFDYIKDALPTAPLLRAHGNHRLYLGNEFFVCHSL